MGIFCISMNLNRKPRVLIEKCTNKEFYSDLWNEKDPYQ